LTLVLALDCSDGLVLAADSQATLATQGQPVKQTTTKIYAQWSNVAWGASGDGGVIQNVENHLRSIFAAANNFEALGRQAARQSLVPQVAARLRSILQSQALNVAGQQPPLTSYLFVGHFNDGPMILEIGGNLLDFDHLQGGVGYSAIGSGDIFPYFALASLAHFNVQRRSLFEAKLLAYRVVDDAIKVAAQGLGHPVQMIEVTKPSRADQPGVARPLTRDEVRIIEDKVEEWRLAESEVLGGLVGITPSASEPNSAETPEPPASTPESPTTAQ